MSSTPSECTRTGWKALFGVPCILTLTRIPLGILFVLAHDHLALEILILVVAATTDVLDGWYARRYGCVSRLGTILDPIADKVFAFLVLISFVAAQRVSWVVAVLLVVRELGELPLVLWYMLTKRGAMESSRVRPNIFGKVATALQIGALVAAGFALDSLIVLVLAVATACAGAAAALSYWGVAVRPADLALRRNPRRR